MHFSAGHCIDVGLDGSDINMSGVCRKIHKYVCECKKLCKQPEILRPEYWTDICRLLRVPTQVRCYSQ